MSNVLIGIIGVILFIGLALAGALFLGSRFQEATINSKAAAAVQAVQQVQNAVELYRLDTGTTGLLKMGTPVWLAPDYLKSVPSNPVVSPAVPYWNSVNINNDVYGDESDEGGQTSGRFAVLMLGPGNQSQRICDAVARSMGVPVVAANSIPVERIGCARQLVGNNVYYYNVFVAV